MGMAGMLGPGMLAAQIESGVAWQKHGSQAVTGVVLAVRHLQTTPGSRTVCTV